MSSDNEFDVIIIGAGLTGLTIAYEILKREVGLSVLILEKNENVGGRILEEGESRAFFGSDYHESLSGLLNQLNIPKEQVDDHGPDLEFLFVTKEGAPCEQLSRFAASQLYHFLKILEWTSTRKIYRKYEASETGSWLVKTSILDYAKKWIGFGSGRKMTIAVLRSCCLGLEALDTVSALWFIVMLNGAGGLFRRLSSNLDSGSRFFVDGGFRRIIRKLEERVRELGGTIGLLEPVLSIERTPRTILVTTTSQKFRSECAVVAIPPPENLEVLEGSGLSEKLMSSQRLYEAGTGSYFWCGYQEAFWKAKTVLVASGQDPGVRIMYTGPRSPGDDHVIAGFSSADVEDVPERLGEIFESDRARGWTSRGRSVASPINPARCSTSDRLMSPMLATWDRRIFLAASEFARWPGTAEGAVEAGRRAAGLVMWRVRPQALRAVERIGYSREIVVPPGQSPDDTGITIAANLLLGLNVYLLLSLLKDVVQD